MQNQTTPTHKNLKKEKEKESEKKCPIIQVDQNLPSISHYKLDFCAFLSPSMTQQGRR